MLIRTAFLRTSRAVTFFNSNELFSFFHFAFFCILKASEVAAVAKDAFDCLALDYYFLNKVFVHTDLASLLHQIAVGLVLLSNLFLKQFLSILHFVYQACHIPSSEIQGLGLLKRGIWQLRKQLVEKNVKASHR